MNFYAFELKYYNEELGTECTECGVTRAATYAEALSFVAEDYYEDCLVAVKIAAVESDCATLSISKENCEDLWNAANIKM